MNSPYDRHHRPRPRTRPRVGRRGESLGSKIRGITLIGLSLAAAVVLIVAVQVFKPAERNEVTLCPVDQLIPTRHTIILVDRTDPLSADAELRQRSLIENVMRSLAVDEKFTLLEVNASEPFAPLVHRSLCKPPASGNSLYENPRRIAERYEASFAEPFSDAIQSIEAGDGEDWSPIFSSIRAVALRPDFSDLVAQRRLIIVSDMLENTADYSVFRNRIDPNLIRNAPTYRPARLDGVQVDVRWVERRNPSYARRQNESLETFWVSLLTHSNARVQYGPAL